MNNQDINIKLNDGGYLYPIKVLETKDALDLSHYYNQTKNKIMKRNLILEHKFKSHLIFKRINDLIRNKKNVRYCREDYWTKYTLLEFYYFL